MERAITYEEAKRMALAHLRRLIATLPEDELYKPMIIVGNRRLSLMDLLREVLNDTVTGRLYVYQFARSRGYTVVKR